MFKDNRDNIIFLEDIEISIEKIERYTTNISFEDFCKNEMLIDAIIRNFEIIGEAVKNIPEDIKIKYPDVEWKETIGFRNILIHDYFGIDLEAIWNTIVDDIPILKKKIVNVIVSEKEIIS